VSEKRLVLLEVQGLGHLGDPFGDYEGRRVFIKGALKEAKWVIAEITSLGGRFGTANCMGSYQNLEEAKNRLEELLGRPKIAEKEEVAKPEKPIKKRAENVVFIGRKPLMNYVVACVISFNVGANEVTLKARGRAISRAVDAVELLKRVFIKELEIKSIETGTEEMVRPEGKRNVSTIEITVRKS